MASRSTEVQGWELCRPAMTLRFEGDILGVLVSGMRLVERGVVVFFVAADGLEEGG